MVDRGFTFLPEGVAKVSPATEFYQRSLVKLPSGRVVRLKRIDPELVRQFMPPEILARLDDDNLIDVVKEFVSRNDMIQLRAVAFLIITGVAEPQFVPKDEEYCTKDEAPIEGIGADLPALLDAIIVYNGLDKAVLEFVKKAAQS